MTYKQPLALWLADFYGDMPTCEEDIKAADELRRLHEVNAELVEALEEICDCPQWPDPATIPKAGIEAAPNQVVLNMSVGLRRIRKAEAALAKATGEQQ